MLFGEAAATYEDARPGYPDSLSPMIAAYAGPVGAVAEIGAGTGKGTAVLARLGAPITCVEPDARMAAVLAARWPSVKVVVSRFEDWTPPPGGVPLLACALAWHWLHPDRCRLAHDALAPGGTLAVFAHLYQFADLVLERTLTASWPHNGGDRPEDWFFREIAGSGLYTDVTSTLVTRMVDFDAPAYTRLVETFSPFLSNPPEVRQRVRQSIADIVGNGTVTIDLRTTLVLARKA